MVFQPQAWIDDCAVDIDCGITVVVTHRVLSLSLDKIRRLGNQDFAIDTVLRAHALEHDGPCRVDVAEPVCEFFGVKDLSEITEDMLLEARQIRLLRPDVTLAGENCSPALSDGTPARLPEGEGVSSLGSGSPDLSQLESNALLGELRRRGLVVSAWSQDDATSTLENDDETGSLTDAQFGLLEANLFARASVSLGELLTARGNQHIADLWDIHRTSLIAGV
ncbi:hypothetical protein AWV80_19355 [Cupriavidus sp. UYMU48A]|nr:hypothetical protein AWV80_19355 [Cupriavidus sp. UYMU48A]